MARIAGKKAFTVRATGKDANENETVVMGILTRDDYNAVKAAFENLDAIFEIASEIDAVYFSEGSATEVLIQGDYFPVAVLRKLMAVVSAPKDATKDATK